MLNLSLSDEDIQITWASWDTCYMEMHMGTKGRRKQSTGKRGVPTVHNNFNNAEINLAPGHEASLTCVRALVCLLYATNLKVIVTQLLKPN